MIVDGAMASSGIELSLNGKIPVFLKALVIFECEKLNKGNVKYRMKVIA